MSAALLILAASILTPPQAESDPPVSSPAVLSQRGTCAYNAKRPAEAAAAYELAIRTYPHAVDTHWVRSALLEVQSELGYRLSPEQLELTKAPEPHPADEIEKWRAQGETVLFGEMSAACDAGDVDACLNVSRHHMELRSIAGAGGHPDREPYVRACQLGSPLGCILLAQSQSPQALATVEGGADLVAATAPYRGALAGHTDPSELTACGDGNDHVCLAFAGRLPNAAVAAFVKEGCERGRKPFCKLQLALVDDPLEP